MSLPVLTRRRTDDDRREHPYCQECKAGCVAKGKDWNQTISNCRGVYSDVDFLEIADATKGSVVELTAEEVKEILDPSYWVYKYLGLRPHWYQDRYLRCTSIRKALRWGRRTGKTHILAAEQVQRCMTSQGLKVTMATPRKAMALEIVSRIAEFLRENPEVGSELERSVQQPYYAFEFKNGSRIRLFVAGVSGGDQAGSTIRGQEADVLVLDELDYVDDDAAAAILPLLSDPQRQGEPIRFAASSTPTGREGLFYKLCNDDEYKEFHVPSNHRPDWDDKKDQEARRNSKTNDTYLHEYEADWGSRTDGVYPRSRVVRAMQEYRYCGQAATFDNEVEWPEMVPWNHWTYMIGVDWNGPGTGSRIGVVGFDPERNKWVVVYREAITIEEFSLHVAVERVVALNRFWKPHSVYIDSGYGQMQDEYLRGIGQVALAAKNAGKEYNPSDLTLATNLKAIDFGGHIEYTVTNEDGALEQKKKLTKNYMVENFQRHFELDSFWFSKSDVDFKAQLMGFAVARQDKHNQNIYVADKEAGDHDHDAVMLALYAFNQEFDPFFNKAASAQYIEVAPRPFQKSSAEDMPDPLSDPSGYEAWTETRRAKGNPTLRSPLDVPSRTISSKPEKIEIPGIMVVPQQQKSRTLNRGLAYRAPVSGRNSWQKKGTNGRGF